MPATGQRVLVIGHSIVYWVAEYAASSRWGSNLGLDGWREIKWSGWRGMRWAALLATLRREVYSGGHSQGVIIQLVENDLPENTGVTLSRAIKQDLSTLRWKLPETQLFWSCLLERRE